MDGHSGMGVRSRVGFAFHPAAHYRASLLRNLDRDSRFEIEFLYDDQRSRQPVQLLDPDSVTSFRRIHLHKAAGMVWLSGVLPRVVLRKYDLLVMTGDPHDISTWVALSLARLLRVRTLLWTQGWLVPEVGLKGFIRRLFYRLADGLLVYGAAAKRIGIEAGFSRDKISVVYNSVPDLPAEEAAPTDAEIAQFADKHKIALDVPKVIFSSRLKPEKQANLLIEASSLLSEAGTPIELLLVGDGDDQKRLRRLAYDRDVTVHLFGSIYDARTLSILYALSCCAALPAQAGLAVIQGLQYGVPVVVSDNPENNGPETEAVIPGVTGVVFSAGSVEDLAKAILAAERLSWRSEVRPACEQMASGIWSPRNQANKIGNAIMRTLAS